MLHYKYLHRSTFIRDGLWLLAINALFFLFFANYDVLELVMALEKKHEHWELDEFLPLGATLTLSLVIFVYRRLVELGRITQAFEELAKQDPLTHALNRRAGQAILHRRYNKAEQQGQGFSLLQLNIDNFKRVNDTYGPSIGDDILINLVKIIQQNIPKKARLIHWHSDNFLIILPANISSLFQFANNLRETIEQQLFTTDTITCSMGLASWPGQEHMRLKNSRHDFFCIVAI